jgi:hypothetical protein
MLKASDFVFLPSPHIGSSPDSYTREGQSDMKTDEKVHSSAFYMTIAMAMAIVFQLPHVIPRKSDNIIHTVFPPFQFVWYCIAVANPQP